MSAAPAIDAATAAAAARAKPVAQRWHGTMRLPSSGREVRLDIPADLTPVELIEMLGFVATQLPHEIVKAAQAQPRILVPT